MKLLAVTLALVCSSVFAYADSEEVNMKVITACAANPHIRSKISQMGNGYKQDNIDVVSYGSSCGVAVCNSEELVIFRFVTTGNVNPQKHSVLGLAHSIANGDVKCDSVSLVQDRR
jgi:hypothetical protein